jgi:two-component system sensor histidine kinase BaeS
MNLRIWHKVALILVVTSSIVLLFTLLLAQQSFKHTFLNYLNQKEQNRVQPLITQLADYYLMHEGWDDFRNNATLWDETLRSSYFRPPPRDKHPEEHRPPRHPARPIALLDRDKHLVVGRMREPNEHFNRPILVDDDVVGYLYFPSRQISRFSDDIDRSFSQRYHRGFIFIGLTALILSLISAWILAHYLRRRIQPLADQAQKLNEGDYSHQVRKNNQDELGQLGNDLNQLAQTLEKNRQSRRRWIADISHELRTPLAILRGELDALEDGIRPLTPKAIKSLSAEIAHLNKLVDDLFQLSLSDLGALTYQKSNIALIEILDDVVKTFTARLEQHSLGLEWKCPDNLDAIIIQGDKERLRQLFTNILENSLRYTDPQGSIHIQCRITKSQVNVIIEDTSPGVEEDHLPLLFNRLYRGEASRNRNTGGAGLGLAIAEEISNAHQAHITAEHSALGGLKLTLTFPLSQ